MKRILGVLTAFMLLPAAAFAQPEPAWATKITRGEPLRIVLRDGERIQGEAGRIDSGGVTVGATTVTLDQILRVERRDPVRNGVLIGAAVGLALGIVPLVYGNECRYETCGSQLGIPVISAAIGAGIGWGVDSAIKGWTSVYDARGAALAVEVAPSRIGLRAAFSW